MDIKHMNSAKHKEFTTQPNELILENAPKIAERVKLTVRVPVIPGFNDTADEIRDIASFAKTLKGVTEMHILPYHRHGADKYAGLGRNYELDGVLPPTDEHMEMLKGVAESVGIKCQIGG